MAREGAETQLAEGGSGVEIAGRYRYERELGRGAQGRVLLVRDAVSGDRLALKLVSGAAEEQVRAEFALLSRIQQPNLARVLELLRLPDAVPALRLSRGSLALVSEYVAGLPADRAMQLPAANREAHALKLALRLLDRAARALQAIHAQGFVHGDVKPQNLIVPEGAAEPKLIDLGLSRAPGFEERPSGTPEYMAPELFRGELSPAADVYALGVSIWRLLAPRTAGPAGASAAELLSRALGDPRKTEPLPGWVPAPLSELLGTLRAADRAQRPTSAGEVVNELVRIAASLPAELAAEFGALAADSRSQKERALALRNLPLSGQREARSELSVALARGGALVVLGPEGAGRSRLIREAVFALQLARSQNAEPLPSYRVVRTVPARPAEVPTIWHVVGADAVGALEVERFVRATEVEAQPSLLVLERTQPLLVADVGQVRVGPLAREELAPLLQAAIAPKKLRPELLDEAAAISGGLAGRLCGALCAGLAAGLDLARPGGLRAAAGVEAEQALVPALPAGPRRLAQALCLAGGSLVLDRLQPMAALTSGELAEGMQLLCALGLASRAGDGRLSLRPDVARLLWQQLGAAARKAQVGALGPAASGDASDPRAEAFLALARGEVEQAAGQFGLCLQKALSAGDPALALELASEAQLYLEAAGDTLELALLRAEASRALGHYAAALELLAPWLAQGADNAQLRPLLLLRAEIERLQGDSAAAGSSARALLAADLPAASPLALGASALLARLELDAGDAVRAERDAAAVLARAGESAPGLRAAEVLGLSLIVQGQDDRARAALDPALALARTRGERAAEARLWSVQGSRQQAAGQLRAAARSFGRAFELADAAGEYHAAASFLVNLGTAQLDAGELGTALETLRNGARRLARLGRERDLARTLYNLALARQLVGDHADALLVAERAVAAAQRAGDAAGAAYASVLCAEALLDSGDPGAARARLLGLPALEGLASFERTTLAARAAVAHAELSDPAAAKRFLQLSEAAAGADAADAELSLARAALAALGGDIIGAQREAELALGQARERGEFALQIAALLSAARAAEARGDAALMRARLSELRAQLDAAALSLSSSDRARLREVRAYRAALAALPTPVNDAQQRGVPASDARFRRLTGIAKRLTAESSPRRLYDLILDSAIDLTHAENGFLLLLDAQGEPRVRAGRSLGERDQAAASISQSIVARVLSSGQPLSTVDALRDDRLLAASSVHALALRSVLVVPLRSASEILGVIYLDDRLRPFAFGEDEVALLGDLADLAAIALEAAERLRRERRAVRRLRATQSELARQLEAQAIELASWKGSEQLREHAGIVAHSPPMRESLELALRVARSDVPVLIRGESGTGKELIAKAIHAASVRAAGPFVSENCGAIPETLLESTLFGHVKGAFTGADRRHLGLFEAADGGTLFLDEIGEMPPAMQVRLLRVLQDGEVRPVGGERATRVDVRVLCATHRDIDAMLESGAFREDLFYRLAVVSLRLPPLRERSEDILPLVQHFLAKYAPGRVTKLDKRLLERLATQAWPGNVRQLENELRRALALGAGETLREEHFSTLAQRATTSEASDLDLRAHVDQLERKLIRRALDAARGNQTRAAELLGLSRFGLQKKLKRLFPPAAR
jgi:serine/threonine-protein kinase PknK